MEARYQLTWADIAARRSFDDAITLGTWGAEWHDRATFESSFELPPEGGAYEIPLGCLISQNRPNLFAAGRNVDGDVRAGASMRVMGTAFATGQAAGVAAALLARDGGIDAEAVRATLGQQGAILDRADMKHVAP